MHEFKNERERQKNATIMNNSKNRSANLVFSPTNKSAATKGGRANDLNSHRGTNGIANNNAAVGFLRRESARSIAAQVFLPYLVAGFGMVGAGLVLDAVQHWNVFRSVPQIFVMVPALLGLKGNLEMTLASRLSTQANLGTIDKPRELWSMAVGNIVVTQAQATVVGFLVSVAAVTFSWAATGVLEERSSVLLGASAVITSSLASLILGVVMILVIVVSRKFSINPDNVATPVAASLGDLTTLCLLAVISSTLHELLDSALWLLYTVLLSFLILTPIWIYVARQNVYTRVVVYDGWVPVISAMLISSIGGVIFEQSIARFPGLAAFQPVINGVGGNLAAIQASRLSTTLHQLYVQPGRYSMVHRHASGSWSDSLDLDDLVNQHEPSTMPDDGVILRRSACPNPINTFLSAQAHSRTARVLLTISAPGHLIFMYSIYFIHSEYSHIRLLFVITYMMAALIQIVALLYVTHWLVQFLWKNGKDPDNFAIPYLTAIGDILGTILLAMSFQTLHTLGDGTSSFRLRETFGVTSVSAKKLGGKSERVAKYDWPDGTSAVRFNEQIAKLAEMETTVSPGDHSDTPCAPNVNSNAATSNESQCDSAPSSTTHSVDSAAASVANVAHSELLAAVAAATTTTGSSLTSGSAASSSREAINTQPIKEVDESEGSKLADSASSADYLRYLAASSSRRCSQDLINLPPSPFSYHRALQARKNRVSFTAAPRYLTEANQCQSQLQSVLPEAANRCQQRRGSKRSLLNAETSPLLAEVKESAVEAMPNESLSASAAIKGDPHESQVCSSPPNAANADPGKHSRSPSFTSQSHFHRQQMARQSIGRLSFQYYYDSAEAQRANQLHQRLLQTQTVFGAEEPKDGIGCIGWALFVLSSIVVIFTFPFSLYFCFRVVQEYERAVIFRLGRLIGGGAKGPGIFFVLPCIEAYTKVDLRTVSFDVPPQEVLTKDSVTVSVDAVIYYRVSNATIAVANVENAHHSTRSLAQTTLRNVLGTKNLSDVLTDRDSVSGAMHHILDEATEQWGITVERVEIKDVRLPVQLQRAMAAEAEASREARAKIIAAEGEMRAAKALKEAATVISESPAALQLRYLQTLNSISSEKNSTIIFPLPIDVLKHFIK